MPAVSSRRVEREHETSVSFSSVVPDRFFGNLPRNALHRNDFSTVPQISSKFSNPEYVPDVLVDDSKEDERFDESRKLTRLENVEDMES